MLGAIAGDIIGSVYEHRPVKGKDFPLLTEASTFTDDTVLTVAVAQALMTDRDYGKAIKAYARQHPQRGYGPRFLQWVNQSGYEPYNSLGNGSAMRVSPVAWFCQSQEEVLHEAERSAACTHNHPEGIKGAQAVALAIWLARHTQDKELIRCTITERFGYNLSDSIDHIRPNYQPDTTCPGSVPQAIIAFLDNTDFEDAIRNAVSLGGDADTQACIAGSIAEAFYGEIPQEILQQIQKKLSPDLWRTTLSFYQLYGLPGIQQQLDPSMR